MATNGCENRVSERIQKDIVQAVLADGCFLWRDYLTRSEMARVRTRLTDLLKSEAATKYRRSQRIWSLANYGEPFTSMILEPRLSSVVSGLLGPEFFLSDFSANVVYPGSEPDTLHVDYPFNEMAGPPVTGLIGIQCVLAIDNFTSHNGATEIVRGSHHQCLPPPSDCANVPEKCVMPSGSLLVLAASTWHRAGINHSRHDRRALLFSFVEGWVRPMTGPDEYSDELIRTASPELKMLLGVLRRPEKIDGVPIVHTLKRE